MFLFKDGFVLRAADTWDVWWLFTEASDFFVYIFNSNYSQFVTFYFVSIWNKMSNHVILYNITIIFYLIILLSGKGRKIVLHFSRCFTTPIWRKKKEQKIIGVSSFRGIKLLYFLMRMHLLSNFTLNLSNTNLTLFIVPFCFRFSESISYWILINRNFEFEYMEWKFTTTTKR